MKEKLVQETSPHEKDLLLFNGAVVPDDALVGLVCSKPSLFPHAVKMLARNRFNKDMTDNTSATYELAPAGLVSVMREVRDELNHAISQCHTEGKVVE